MNNIHAGLNGSASASSAAVLTVEATTEGAPLISTGLFREPPRPLMRDLPPAEPFPVAALPSFFQDTINANAEMTQADPALSGQCILAACTLAAQGHVDVEMPYGAVVPVSEYFGTIAASSERKTTASKLACEPIRQQEKRLGEQFDFDMENYEEDHQAWKQAILNAKAKIKTPDKAAIKEAIKKVGPEPRAPIFPMLTSAEPTIEGLLKNAARLHPSIGIFASEGGQFTGGHGFSEESKLRNAAAYSSLWDGEGARRIRAGDGVAMIENRRLVMDLQFQPEVAALFYGDELLKGQGLLSRFLPAFPESRVGTRTIREVSAKARADHVTYVDHLADILGRPWPMMQGGINGLAPQAIGLSSVATGLWNQFADFSERQQADGGAFENIRGFAGKLAEHAARLAATIETIINPIPSEVSHTSLAAGVALAQYYASEAVRIFEAGRVNPDLHLAQKVWAWLSGTWQGSYVSLPDIYQRGPVTAIRDKSRAAFIVGILDEHGYLQKMKGGMTINGTPRRDVWAIFGRVA